MTKAEAARQKKEARLQSEIERVEKMRAFERDIVQRAGGSGLICGIDEAGRGPLAGPVAAAAVILPEDLVLPYLNDSKKVTEKRREMLYDQIREKEQGTQRCGNPIPVVYCNSNRNSDCPELEYGFRKTLRRYRRN